MSKALEKSRNIPVTISPLSKFDINLFIRVFKAMYDECCFLNPNWPANNNLWISKNYKSRSYITFSKTLTEHTIGTQGDNCFKYRDLPICIMVEHVLIWVRENSLSIGQIAKVSKRLINGPGNMLEVSSSYAIMTSSAIFRDCIILLISFVVTSERKIEWIIRVSK